MKSLAKTIALAAALTVPALGFAQSNSHLTRAQVRQELIQVEQAGYRPGDGDATQYPVNIQRAEEKVEAQRAAESAYGASPSGSSSSSADASR